MSAAAARSDAWGARARDWAENEVQQLPTYEEAIRRAPVRPGDRVLDMGCGSGVFLRACVDAGAGAVAGVDASRGLIAIARERVPPAELVVGDMQSLPFADASFDVVAGFNSFFFAADMVAALREAGRVARRGAPVVIQVWGRGDRCDLRRMTVALRELRGARPDDGPALCAPGVLEGIAEAAGLRPREAFDLSYEIRERDAGTLVRRMLSPPPVAGAAAAMGEDVVRETILTSLAPFRRADGSYTLANEWHFLIAEA